jgi:hypothetical protein
VLGQLVMYTAGWGLGQGDGTFAIGKQQDRTLAQKETEGLRGVLALSRQKKKRSLDTAGMVGRGASGYSLPDWICRKEYSARHP